MSILKKVAFIMSERKGIIFAGPLRHKGGVGGVVVLFEDLVSSLNPMTKVIDTNAKNYYFPFLMVFNFLLGCISASLKGQEVSLHGSKRDYKYLGFILLAFNKFFGLRYHTRKFAGNFDYEYINFNFFWRWVVRQFLFNSCVNYFETKSLVNYFSSFNSKTLWFPNYRTESMLRSMDEFQGRFIFVGHVKREKGIDEIIALGRLLPPGWLVDVYGPLIGYSPESFRSKNVCYRGVLEPAEVASVIAQYNALLLPTFHASEGYPGVVIEAYSVGAPVVVTYWCALPEIVDEKCGEFVEPHDVKSLLQGMHNVAEKYSEKRDGASKRFDEFSRKRVLGGYFKNIGLSC